MLLAFIILWLAGCKPCDSKEFCSHAEAPYSIVCTVGMITDVVRNIVGELAQVEGIMAEGVDPHLYSPTRNDVVKLHAADVVFYNGLSLEGRMGEVLNSLASTGKPVKAVAEAILENVDYPLSSGNDSLSLDPHVWMDVQGWMQSIPVIVGTLSEHDPSRASAYQANALAYMNKLEKLDAYAKEVLATISEGQRVLVTAHDAFSYMGQAYGFEVRGIQGISTESEAGVRDLEELVDFIVRKRISAVFVEISVSDRNVHALVEGARARGHEVLIGGKLFSDAMGERGSYEGTYIGMIDHNVTTIVNSLGGTARGFKRWLAAE